MSYDPGSGAIVPATAADARAAVSYLRTPLAIRVRAANVLEAGLLGELRHFTVARERIDVVADRVIAVTRAAHPSLRIPYHGRLAHFRAGGVDRVAPGVFGRGDAARPQRPEILGKIGLLALPQRLAVGAAIEVAPFRPGARLVGHRVPGSRGPRGV